MIIMDSKVQLTVDIIAKVAESKITINNATKLLNKSRGTVERYLQQYHKVDIRPAKTLKVVQVKPIMIIVLPWHFLCSV